MYFIWNEIDNIDMDVKVVSLPPFSLSENNVNEIEIEGRDGFLTENLGYKGDTKTVECDYYGDNPESILDWLKGNGEVVFENMDNYYFKARISNNIPLEQVLKNRYNFIINFRCQPYKYLLNGKRKTILKNNSTFLNSGNIKALPKITIAGTGNITVNINGRVFSISNLDNSITIVSEIQEVLNGKGNLMEGDFPYLDSGRNAISWTGNVTKFELVSNMRCL